MGTGLIHFQFEGMCVIVARAKKTNNVIVFERSQPHTVAVSHAATRAATIDLICRYIAI